jgi:hypothetical protein
MLGAFVGLAWRRLRHRWRLDLARWLGLSLAIALALTIAITQALADDAGSAVMGAVGPRGVVTIERPQTRDVAGYDTFQAEVRDRVGRELGGALRAQARYLASGGMRPVTLNGAQLQPDLTLTPGVAWYADVERHVAVTVGAWPQGAPSDGVRPVAASATGADLLAIRPADVLCMQIGGTAWTTSRTPGSRHEETCLDASDLVHQGTLERSGRAQVPVDEGDLALQLPNALLDDHR